jgi:hypothetical protein
MSEQASQRWFVALVDLALKHRIMSSDELMAHATPEALASHLPSEVIARLLTAALASGTMTSGTVLQVVTPELLARHLPLALLWRAVSTAVERTPIPTTAISGATGRSAALGGAIEGER